MVSFLSRIQKYGFSPGLDQSKTKRKILALVYYKDRYIELKLNLRKQFENFLKC